MGEGNDEPRPGFDYFVTHKGQGKYFDTEFNFNGQRREVRKGYYTTEITNIALDWLQKDHAGKPWMMILGHKAAHSFYTPEPKYANAFADVKVAYPQSAFQLDDKPDGSSSASTPGTASTDRSSNGGRSFPTTAPKRCRTSRTWSTPTGRTILSVDDSVGRLRAWLEETGQLDNTIIVFVGDNGLLEGEHGMVDKRTMHEPSIRIPMAVRYPGLTREPQGRLAAGADQWIWRRVSSSSPAHRRCRMWTAAHGSASPATAIPTGAELVLLLQLREGVSLHAERARHPHRGMEIHPLPAR